MSKAAKLLKAQILLLNIYYELRRTPMYQFYDRLISFHFNPTTISSLRDNLKGQHDVARV